MAISKKNRNIAGVVSEAAGVAGRFFDFLKKFVSELSAMGKVAKITLSFFILSAFIFIFVLHNAVDLARTRQAQITSESGRVLGVSESYSGILSDLTNSIASLYGRLMSVFKGGLNNGDNVVTAPKAEESGKQEPGAVEPVVYEEENNLPQSAEVQPPQISQGSSNYTENFSETNQAVKNVSAVEPTFSAGSANSGKEEITTSRIDESGPLRISGSLTVEGDADFGGDLTIANTLNANSLNASSANINGLLSANSISANNLNLSGGFSGKHGQFSSLGVSSFLSGNSISAGEGGLSSSGLTRIINSSSGTALTVTQKSSGDIMSVLSGSDEIFNINSSGATLAGDFTINGSASSFSLGSTTPYGKLSISGDGIAPSFVVGDSTSTSFIVDANGNIGVGISSPTEKLHLQNGTLLIDGPSTPTLAGAYDTAHVAQDVYVSGKYAYIADSMTGLLIVDISDVARPSLVGTYNTSGVAKGVFVSGKYAYVADYDFGLQIIDISNPSSPRLAGTYNTDGLSYGVYISGKYAYVADWTYGLQVIDISNPLAPTLVGNYNTDGSASGIYIAGNYAYVADWSYGLQVIDISNPTSPSLEGVYDTDGTVFGVYISGKYAYVADSEAGLQIIDISSSTAPTLAGSYNTTGVAYNVYVSGKYAYVADYASGLQIIDVSSSTAPTLAGSYDSTGDSQGVFISGKYAYMANRNSGLEIVDIGGADIHALTVGNISTNDIAVLENMNVGNNLYIRNGLNVGSGGIMTDSTLTVSATSTFIGYVGIGSSTPYAKLSLTNTGTSPSFLVEDSASPDSTPFIIDASGNVGINTANPAGLFDVNGKLVVLSGGNVGIGTTTPNNKLDIYSTTKSAIGFSGASGNNYKWTIGMDVTNGGRFSIASSTALGTLDRLVIDGNGNVGIGTTTPKEKLHIQNGTLLVDGPSTPTLAGRYATTEAYDVYVSGKYAYVADTTSGLRIIDISNPALPTLIATYDATLATGVFVFGKYAYVADQGDGLKIIDISNPTTPTLIGTHNTAGNANKVYISGKYAYVADNAAGLQIVDISNPYLPTLVGSIDTLVAMSIYVSGKYAYVADFNSLKVIDISNPFAPTQVGTIATTDAHDVYISGRYAYVADFGAGLKIIDISSSTAPVLAGTYDTDGSAWGVYISGKYAYVGSYGSGLQIVDISSSTAPTLAGSYTTVDRTRRVFVSGRYAYLADWSYMRILDIKGGDIHALTAGNINVGNIGVNENVDIGNNLYVRNGLNVGSGGIMSDGVLTVTATSTFVGRVGIGTTTPMSQLSVVKISPIENEVIFAISTSTSGTIFTVDEDGDIAYDGAASTPAADYAEYYYTINTDLEPGEAVCVDVERANAIKRCDRSADDNLMGIVSTKPAIVGNSKAGYANNPNYKIIGMLGQVPAKVTTENGPIRPGDSLTSAYEAGYLMKASAGDSTVGVALEGLDGSRTDIKDGVVNVLISRRNKSLTVEQVEEKVTERIANMEIEDEVNILIAKSIENLNLDEEINSSLNPKLLMLETKLTVKSNDLEGRLVNTEKSLETIITALAQMENRIQEEMLSLNQIKEISGYLTIDEEGNITIASDNFSSIEIITATSTAKTAFVINQTGAGDIADFQANEVSIMKIANQGKVSIIGELLVDGRIMACSGGTCGDNLDEAVDETMGDIGVEGKVVAGAFEGYCEDGFVWVPGSAKYGTLPGFCVAETKAVNEENQIWTNISQGEAQLACQNLGTGYHLISENEWLTIAENIIKVGENDIDRSESGLQLATGNNGVVSFVLNNGNIIFDLVSEKGEWTDRIISLSSNIKPAKETWQEYYEVDLGDVNFAPPYYLNSENGIGKILTGSSERENNLIGFVRGEYGVYSLNLSYPPTIVNENIGFRCAR